MHRRETGSTNADAAALGARGAPHGTLVTAAVQTAGRGRQGRGWSAPPDQALLLSLVLRSFDPLLTLRAGLAVADVAGAQALVKWPNDVLIGGRKVAGVLSRAFPREGWAVLGIGVNAAVDVDALPADLRARAGGLGHSPGDLEPLLDELLAALERRLQDPAGLVLAELRRRDALRGRPVAWTGGRGTAAGLDDSGALVVDTEAGEVHLDAGEVHLRDV